MLTFARQFVMPADFWVLKFMGERLELFGGEVWAPLQQLPLNSSISDFERNSHEEKEEIEDYFR